jgi:hypothetical protein
LKKKTSLVLVLLVAISSFSILGTGKTQAYAEFDKSGNYVCNPFARGLETNIYSDIVHKINDKMTMYMKTHPNATVTEQHDVMLQDQQTWNLYNKSKECISAIGINPDDIIALDTNVTQAITVPEFGMSSPIVAIVAIIVSIVIYRKFLSRSI